jgi:cell division GTPase FtsZ
MAMASPMLDQTINGAHGVLLSIQGGSNLAMMEVNEAASLITDVIHPEANFIFGMSIDDTLGDEVRVTVIAAGFDDADLGRHDRVGSLESFQTLDEEIRHSDSVGTSTTTDIPVLTDQFVDSGSFDGGDQWDLPRFFRG